MRYERQTGVEAKPGRAQTAGLRQTWSTLLEAVDPASLLMLSNKDLACLSVSCPDLFMPSGRESNGRAPGKESQDEGSDSSLPLWLWDCGQVTSLLVASVTPSVKESIMIFLSHDCDED